ncbi:LysR family transcriptional regulator, partial [Pseudomonas aeruginosa]|nr:LysR family transcriptional regulator [Pseudomonas aeruginosa]
SLTSPIIVSRRQGDGSPHLRRCLALIGREDA